VFQLPSDRIYIIALALALSTGWLHSPARAYDAPVTEPTAVNRDVEQIAPDLHVPKEVITPFKATRPRLILALSGGGCKAVAQIGVLRSFEKNGIAIDGIVGTSMGATVGALYCAGVSLDTIESMFLSGDLQRKMFKGLWVHMAAAPIGRVVHLVKQRPYAGLTDGKAFRKYLAGRLPDTFDELKKPFACVVTNLGDGKTEVLSKGDLPTSVRASNAVPVLARPVDIDGKIYVDGALRANLPSEVAKNMHPDLVVAVLVDSALKPISTENFRSKWRVLNRVVDIIVANSDKGLAQSTDLLIYPDVDEVPYLTSDRKLLETAIKSGELTADGAIAKIKERLAGSHHSISTTSTTNTTSNTSTTGGVH
jgi:NTE family protein